MRHLIRVALALAMLGGPVVAHAQAGSPSSGQPAMRMFDPKTVTTMRGEIVALKAVDMPYGHMAGARMGAGVPLGIHAQLQADDGEELDVHLGPAWFIRDQPLKLQPGDTVEILGSRVTIGGQPTIIASEVRLGDKVLTLRDASGRPVWPRGKRPGAGAGAPGSG